MQQMLRWAGHARYVVPFAGLFAVGCPHKPPSEPTPVPPRADLVMVSGIVVSDEHPGASAIAVDEGWIVDIGGDDAVAAWIGDDTKVVDLRGATVLPGLVDAHVHLGGLGIARAGLDLVGTGSIDEIKEKVAAAVKEAEPGEWIRGRGWDQNDWEGFPRWRKFPSAQDLDDVSPKNPVVLTRIDGHAIWVNSLAMKTAGVSRTSRVKGGQVVRRRGRPSGVFIDNAMSLIRDKVPPLTGRELEKAMLLAQKECLTAGLTQVHDMGVDALGVETLKKLDAEGKLKLRVYAMHDGMVEDLEPVLAEGPITPEPDGGAHLTLRGVKLFLDGALGSRGAALLEPYTDDRRNRGQLLIEEEELEKRVRMAKEKGFQVATHAIGDRANRIVLDTYERVFGGDAWALRPRVEHAQVLHPDDIPRFGRLGILASVQPTQATSDMPWAEERVGSERIKGAYAWQALLTTNATIAAGSDAPVEDISPVLGLYAAITRKDLFGSPKDGWYPDQRMTPEEAVRAFTWGGAWASFTEDHRGKIEKGYLGDLTVLSENPLTATEDKLASMQVMLTIIGGEVVYAKPGADRPPATMTATTSTTAG